MRNDRSTSRSGFTLIELLMVMVLLIVVVSLVTPTLERFFGGRALDSEVRQFVSLTRYGQSRAVSEGIPMVLWVDTKAKKYGLREEPGYTDGEDSKAVEYSVNEGLTVGLDQVGSKPALPGKMTGIHFSPEGMATTTSVKGVSFQEGKNKPVWVRRSGDGLTYEVSQ